MNALSFQIDKLLLLSYTNVKLNNNLFSFNKIKKKSQKIINQLLIRRCLFYINSFEIFKLDFLIPTIVKI